MFVLIILFFIAWTQNFYLGAHYSNDVHRRTFGLAKEQASNTTSEGDEFLLKIQSAISKKNKYPRIARIRGLEGEVLIEFTLDVDGTLQGLKIIQSSAGDILNENALKAIVSASKDFPKPEQRVRIKIPIAYFLRN